MTRSLPPEIEAAKRAKDAERQRRYRRRLTRGDQFFRGDLPFHLLAKIIDCGLIAANDATNPDRVGRALVALVDSWDRRQACSRPCPLSAVDLPYDGRSSHSRS